MIECYGFDFEWVWNSNNVREFTVCEFLIQKVNAALAMRKPEVESRPVNYLPPPALFVVRVALSFR